MGSVSPNNCGVKYLLCVIVVFTKHHSVKTLKNKKDEIICNGFTEIK